MFLLRPESWYENEQEEKGEVSRVDSSVWVCLSSCLTDQHTFYGKRSTETKVHATASSLSLCGRLSDAWTSFWLSCLGKCQQSVFLGTTYIVYKKQYQLNVSEHKQ